MGLGSSPPARYSSPATTNYNPRRCVVRLNRTRCTPGALWWRCLDQMVTGVTTATMFYGGALWPPSHHGLQRVLGWTRKLQRCVRSPCNWRDDRRRQLWPEMSAASRIPANFTGKGTMNIWWLKASQLDSFFLEVLGVEAELWGHTADLRVSSIAGERTWPELGFQVCERIQEREKRMRWI
jgi:hypothetical protein